MTNQGMINKEKITAFLSRSGNGSVALRKALASNFREVVFTQDEIQIAREKWQKTKILLGNSNRYPNQLKHLSDYPSALFYKGNPALLKKKIVTVVGTRNSSDYSRRVINRLFRSGLWSKNITLLSGLAYGVDALVHQVALRNNISTVAVVAGGIDVGYPRGNQNLYDQISKDGCVTAEFPPGKPIVKGMFPMRNRLMAALADIVLVIEGGEKSGSLITANLALELGKDVYAVPSDIDRKVGNGSNLLIQNGAGVITSHQDLLNALDIDVAEVVKENLNLTVEELKVFKIIEKEGEVTKEVIIQVMKMNISAISVLLMKLEMDGVVKRNGRGSYEIY